VRFRGTVAYVGTFFHGWQIQDNAARTVQAVVEAALSRILDVPTRAHAAGRTDAGVHADGQVVHFDGETLVPADALLHSVNARLPWDVKFLSLGPAVPSFHARADARAKRYVYRFSREPVIAPREALFWAPLSRGADASRMDRASRRIVGEHDFLGFSTSGTPTKTTVRRVDRCEIREDGARITIAITADGFLRGMARAIAGTLAAIGRGRVAEDLVDEIFAGNDKSLVPAKAKPRGLTLEEVFYETLET